MQSVRKFCDIFIQFEQDLPFKFWFKEMKKFVDSVSCILATPTKTFPLKKHLINFSKNYRIKYIMFLVNILFEDAEDPIEDVTLTAREGGREGTRSMFADGESGRLTGRALKKL